MSKEKWAAILTFIFVAALCIFPKLVLTFLAGAAFGAVLCWVVELVVYTIYWLVLGLLKDYL